MTQQTDARSRPDEIFRLLVESVKDYAIFLLDREGRVASWNEGARSIKGYSAEEIIGTHFSVFYPPPEAQRGKPDYALRVAADEGTFVDEGWRVRKDGARFWASVVITALRDHDGTLLGYAKVTRDLTERQRTEDERRALLDLERGARLAAESALEQLRAVQAVTEAGLAHLGFDELLTELLDRISLLLSTDTAAVFLLDDEERVLVARAAKGLEEEVERGVRIPVGHGFAGRIASEERPIVLNDVEHADVLNPILREKGIRSLLGVPLIVQGRVIGVLHVGTRRPRRFTDDDVWLLRIAADRAALAIDHARLFESAMTAKQQAETVEETLRARDEFVSVAAHELKTPMTSAKAAAQLLATSLARSPGSDPRHVRTVQIIDEQIGKLARLVNQLLETVRVQSGHFSLDREDVDLGLLLRRIVDPVQPASPKHTIVVDSGEGIVAAVDPLRIEQVIANLLDNAIKFSPHGGVIEITAARGGPTTALVAVRDHGLGIAPEHRAHIFDRFYQAHADRSGMGLGLYITRQIVESHGGTIYAECPSDGGSRFVMSLPLTHAVATSGADDAR